MARSAQARGKTIARADYTKVVVIFLTLTPDDMDDAAPSLYVNQLLAFEDRTRQPLCRYPLFIRNEKIPIIHGYRYLMHVDKS